jgi:hypothetical protein
MSFLLRDDSQATIGFALRGFEATFPSIQRANSRQTLQPQDLQKKSPALPGFS